MEETTPEITPEIQALIDAAVDAATTKLNNKNAELRTEARDAKTAKTSAETELKTLKTEALSNKGDWEALKAQLEADHKAEITALQDQVNSLSSENNTFKVDSVITRALAEGGLKEGLHGPLEYMFKAEASAQNLSGDALATYMAGELKSERAKAWIVAPMNVGTGSQGVRDSNAHGYTKETWTLTEASKVANSDLAQAKAIDASLGNLHGL